MIQRIQTIWLLVASALSFATLSVSFCNGYLAAGNTKEFVRLTAMQNILLLILTIAVAITAFMAIFLYKNRKLQIRMSAASLIVSVINLFIYYQQSTKFLPEEKTFAITALVAIFIPFILFLAIRGVYRDNQRMKNLDRLR